MGKCISCKVRRYCKKAEYKSKGVRRLICKRLGGRACLKKDSIACHECNEPLDDTFYKPKSKISIDDLKTLLSSVESTAARSFNSITSSDNAQGVSSEECVPSTSPQEIDRESAPSSGSYSFVGEDSTVEELLELVSSNEWEEEFLSSDDSTVDFEFVSDPEANDYKGPFDIHYALEDSITEKGCDLNHPICGDCSDLLLKFTEEELSVIENDIKDYRKYLEGLETDIIPEPEINKLIEELKELNNVQEKLSAELVVMEHEQNRILEEIEESREEAKKLNEKKEILEAEYIRCYKVEMDLHDEYESINNQVNYVQTQIQKLTEADVFKATWHIWNPGDLGMINNFRLGRLAELTVPWSEINKAWGQLALLLSALARKVNLKFKNYNLVPFGDHSYIEIKSDKSIVPLYGCSSGCYTWANKTDKGMGAFLDCLSQLQNKLGQNNIALPHKIKQGKIIDPGTSTAFSIKTILNSEENWTKALKLMLTNLRWSILYACKEFMDDIDDKSS